LASGLEFIERPEELSGFVVHAVDGRLGVVVEASHKGLLVRRHRLLRRGVVIPSRAIDRIDPNGRTVWLNRTKREVSRIPQPIGSGPSEWFVPASMRVPGTNPVIGPTIGGEPPPRDEDESER
jgi:hypothetical protein